MISVVKGKSMEERFLKSKKAIFSIFILFFLAMVPLDCFSGVIFQEDFESWPADWKCADGNTVPLAHGWTRQNCSQTALDNFGSQTKMGPGHNSKNAYYYYIKGYQIYSGKAGAGTGTLADCSTKAGGGVCDGGFPKCYKLYDPNANFGGEKPVATVGLSPIRDPNHSPGLPPPAPSDRWSNASCVVDSHTLYTFNNYWSEGSPYEIWFPPNSYRGCLDNTNLAASGVRTNEIYVRYYIKAPTTFDKVGMGAKVVRLHTENLGTVYLNIASSVPPYTLRSGQFVFLGGTAGAYRSNITFSMVADNTWHCLEFRVKLNNPGQKNGIAEIWIDGGKTAHWSNTNCDFTPVTSDHYFTEVWQPGLGLGNYSNEKWNMTDWTPIAFDDVVISTNYIGTGIGGTTGTTENAPPSPPTGLKVIP